MGGLEPGGLVCSGGVRDGNQVKTAMLANIIHSVPLTWQLTEGPLKRNLIFLVPSAMIVEGRGSCFDQGLDYVLNIGPFEGLRFLAP